MVLSMFDLRRAPTKAEMVRAVMVRKLPGLASRSNESNVSV
jgi:hypothetical protein